MLTIVLSGIVVLVTHALEAITGFGCTVLALPFLSSLLGLKNGVMVATTIAWILAWYIVITKRKDIVWKQVLIIIVCMLIGLPLGMYLFQNGDSSIMKKVLAVFITIVSIWQLLKILLVKGEQKQVTHGNYSKLYYLLLVIGGVVHGMFSSGGPLVVLYASKTLPDKHAFRASLCVVWATLNTVILASYFGPHSGYTEQTLVTTLSMVPFLVGGIVIGEKVHDKIDARTFSIVVYAMLLLTGFVMLFS